MEKGGDFGGEASYSDDSSYKAYESGTYFDSFESDGDRVDELGVELGLIEAIFLLFPNAKVRNCARHLYNNFKNIEGFRGQVMRLTYWKAAKSTFPIQFEEAMSEMRSLSEFAEFWLRDKDPRTWSRVQFSTRCKSDLLLNNNSECFNKFLTLKCYFVYTIWPVYAGNEKYEVDCRLGNKDMEPILPPIIRRPPGRPKQTRRKEVDEVRKSGPKLSKTGQQTNCTKCGKPGHNTRTCKGIVGVCEKLEGAYSMVFVTEDKLVAVRDPHGFKPLVMGRRSNGAVVFSFETCALNLIEVIYEREVYPGEMLVVDKKDRVKSV
ncbi:hypothetical protein GOBAR_AA26776 [Gossypium barbadense]|uniref:CCHC-type domain-containing protein n=1 Tax=Gossypium barbadense TaxID=3634 RepID=A0A2P5WS43_GOSBA|nr:hypothetical protein GOBAR_AA26776 [Gossypium barbadense]